MYGINIAENTEKAVDVLRVIQSSDGSYLYITKDKYPASTNPAYNNQVYIKIVKTSNISNPNNMSYYKKADNNLNYMKEINEFKEEKLREYTQLPNGYSIRSSTPTATIDDCIKNTLSNKIIVENIPMQRWFHLAVVADESALEVYIDGKLYKTTVLLGAPRTNDGKLYVSQDSGFDGLLNELRYYPRALSYSDIYTMYARGPTPFYFKDMLKDKYQKLEDDYYITNRLKETQKTNPYL